MIGATYRLQFRNGVDFRRAAELAPTLARRGITHLYASPVFAATSGSTHGYDVTDHNAFDPTLGGEEGFRHMCAALHAAGLKLILDIVPNHMAASPENGWWHDVLRHGRSSSFAGHFDIDWTAPKLVLPILGKPFGDALSAGEITRGEAPDGTPRLIVPGHVLPLAPGTETISDIAALHEAQHYRVAHWRLGRDGLTYRRFFEITGLVGVCVEKTAVFDDVHRLLEDLVREGLVHGVRVDHVDGLADPSAYLSRLSERLDVPVLIEKIVEAGEALPPWPVTGTTGYEFIAAMAALLVDGAGLEALSKEYRAIGNDDVGALVRAAKREMVRHNFAGEHSRLGQLAEAAFAQDLAKRDHGPSTLRDGLEALLSAMPVYRTYLRPRAEEPSPRDRAVLAEAVAGAGRQKLDTPQVVDDLAALLLKPPRVQEADEFVTRFQQLSGPVMAKAVEDTVFFRHHRFIGTNEVGGGQPAFGSQAYEAAVMSTGLVASQTHDTKRGADARARLYALSEPQAVQTFATIWPKLPGDIPDRIKWCMAQMLFAAEPLLPDPSFAARFQEAALKTVREAKEETSWTRTNAGFEARIADAAQAMVAEKALLEPLWPVRRAGAVLGLSAAVLQLFGKATPDIYQGGFAWDFSMVDPDNRRPVDFAAEDALCALARASSPQSLLEDWTSGAVKASVLLAGLSCRKRHPALFAEGSLRRVEVTPVDSGIAAFERRLGGEAALAVVPTKPLKHLNQVGISIFLQTKPVVSSAGQFRNLFTGAAVEPSAGAIADELSKFPVFLGVLEA